MKVGVISSMWESSVSNDISDINILMDEVLEMQNLDGSFGDGEKHRYTSYFLIATTLHKIDKSPLLLIIKRALNYILYSDSDSSMDYFALKLLEDKSSFQCKEIRNKIVSMEHHDKLGNLLYIYNFLLVNDIEKFSLIMFNRSFRKNELINFLLNEINNSYG